MRIIFTYPSKRSQFKVGNMQVGTYCEIKLNKKPLRKKLLTVRGPTPKSEFCTVYYISYCVKSYRATDHSTEFVIISISRHRAHALESLKNPQ